MNEEMYSILDQIEFTNEELYDYKQFCLRIKAERELYAERNAENTDIIGLFDDLSSEMTIRIFNDYVKYRKNGIGSLI